MPVRPSLLERLALFRLNQGPAMLVDMVGGAGTRAASLAVELGLFDAVDALDAGEGVAAERLAAELDTDPEATDILAAFLVELGYLRRRGEGYAVTAMTEKWVLTDAETSMAAFLRFWTDYVFPYWDEQLATAVREGAPTENFYDWLDDQPGGWRTTQEAFRETAAVLGDGLLDAVDVPADATRLLDVGGGHGEYSVRFCERHPALHATVFDRPAALTVAEERIENAGLGDRIETRGGDYMTDDLGAGYDLALCFNVLHGHDEAGVRTLIGRVADALAPGGRVAILDQFTGTDSGGLGGAAVRMQGVNYLAMLGGEVHAVDAVRDALLAAGFVDVDRTGLRRAPGQHLVQARLGE